MILINFGHPLTPEQRVAIEQSCSASIERETEIKAQFDPDQPFAAQAKALVDSAGLSGTEWQTLPILVSLPTLHVIAAVTLAELNGRMGYFPSIVRLKPVPDSTPPVFQLAEIINLQAVRDKARQER
ncbi:MAG: hypothetical protein HUU60_11330 [Armatimonadetes bacterium]|nr:hypothetical protein [Armatimonadota bacterium]